MMQLELLFDFCTLPGNYLSLISIQFLVFVGFVGRIILALWSRLQNWTMERLYVDAIENGQD